MSQSTLMGWTAFIHQKRLSLHVTNALFLLLCISDLQIECESLLATSNKRVLTTDCWNIVRYGKENITQIIVFIMLHSPLSFLFWKEMDRLVKRKYDNFYAMKSVKIENKANKCKIIITAPFTYSVILPCSQRCYTEKHHSLSHPIFFISFRSWISSPAPLRVN